MYHGTTDVDTGGDSGLPDNNEDLVKPPSGVDQSRWEGKQPAFLSMDGERRRKKEGEVGRVGQESPA